MIKIYVLPHHLMSRSAQRWFEENKILYQLRKVTDDDILTEEEIMDMIYSVTDIDMLISRTAVVKNEQLKEMCIKSEFVPFVQKNPRALKFPIIKKVINGTLVDITTGYSSEGYRKFLSREVKEFRLAELKKDIKKHFNT